MAICLRTKVYIELRLLTRIDCLSDDERAFFHLVGAGAV
jgi:hypothetical protein